MPSTEVTTVEGWSIQRAMIGGHLYAVKHNANGTDSYAKLKNGMLLAEKCSSSPLGDDDSVVNYVPLSVIDRLRALDAVKGAK